MMRITPEEVAQAIFEAEEAARIAHHKTPLELRGVIPIYNPAYRTPDEILDAQTDERQRISRRPGAMKTVPGKWY